MIAIKLQEYMDLHDIDLKDMVRETGLPKSVIISFRKLRSTQLALRTLDLICQYCALYNEDFKLTDIFDYID